MHLDLTAGYLRIEIFTLNISRIADHDPRSFFPFFLFFLSKLKLTIICNTNHNQRVVHYEFITL
jgi:hypothetical protein